MPVYLSRVMCASMESASRTRHSTNRRAIASHRGIYPRTANGRSPNSHHRVPMTSTVPAAGSSGPWSQNHDPLPLCLRPLISEQISWYVLRCNTIGQSNQKHASNTLKQTMTTAMDMRLWCIVKNKLQIQVSSHRSKCGWYPPLSATSEGIV